MALLVNCDRDCHIKRPDHQHHRSNAEIVTWRCPDGELWIDFDGPSPFVPYPAGPTHFHAPQNTDTAPARVDPAADAGQTLCPNSGAVHCKPYKYTVRVQRPDLPRPCVKDPRMIIDDGGPTPGPITPALLLAVGLALTGWALTQLMKRE